MGTLRMTVAASLRCYSERNRPSTVTFENGSRIVLGHYQHETDIDAYLGLEYDLIAIEEAMQPFHFRTSRSVMECASPLALSPALRPPAPHPVPRGSSAFTWILSPLRRLGPFAPQSPQSPPACFPIFVIGPPALPKFGASVFPDFE